MKTSHQFREGDRVRFIYPVEASTFGEGVISRLFVTKASITLDKDKGKTGFHTPVSTRLDRIERISDVH